MLNRAFKTKKRSYLFEVMRHCRIQTFEIEGFNVRMSSFRATFVGKISINLQYMDCESQSLLTGSGCVRFVIQISKLAPSFIRKQ